jgi:hypothetical protein
MRNYLILIGFIVLSSLSAWGFYTLWRSAEEKSDRLFDDIKIIKGQLQYSQDSLRAETKVLRLTVREIKDIYPSLKTELKEQGIKLRNIEQYQRSLLGIDARFDAVIKALNDTTTISAFTNKWINYVEKRTMGDTSSYVQMTMDVPLEQVIEKVRKPKYWVPFSGEFLKKELKQKIWTENPYCLLKYNEVIQTK